MRKEVLIAIIIGFALGLVITFGIWTANKALTGRKAEVPPEAEVTPEVQVTPTPSFFLEIISPEDESISDKEKITLSGKTLPGTVVAIAWEKGEDVVEAEEDGSFETEVTLVSGTNEIFVTAFEPEGEETTKSLNIVYSTAEI